MSETSGMRIIYLVHPSKGVPAPELMVRFKCPVCGGEDIIDAFRGVPICGADRVALEGISVIREQRDAPAYTHPEGSPAWDAAVAMQSSDKGVLDRSATDELDARFSEETP